MVDLRQWDFARKGNVTLHGQWLFYPGKLLTQEQADADPGAEYRTVPDVWEGGSAGGKDAKGAGTYRLHVLLPAYDGELALRNWTVATSFQLEVNGRLAAQGGKPALRAEDAAAGYNPGITVLGAGVGELDILVRVSNHEYRAGGIWHAFALGPAEVLDAQLKRSTYGAVAIFAAIAAIALNSLAVFFFRRRELPFLFFAVFALSLSLRPLVTGDYALVDIFPAIPFGLLVRIEYATAFLSVPAAAVFFLALFKGILKKVWGLILTVPFAPFVLMDLFAPLDFLTRSIFFFYVVALAALAVMVVLIVGRAAYRRQPDGVIMLIGGIFLGLAGINDILYTTFILHTGNLFPVSLVVFMGLQAIVLARRFTGAFDRVEVLSAELSVSNARLTEEVRMVTEAGARTRLLLEEKEMLVREVHHRVKNSLQIVSSILALQAGSSGSPAVEEITRSIRHRIRAISLAHEKLYSLASGERINLDEYVRQLTGLTVSSFGTDGGAVEISVDSERLEAPAGISIDIGLILTELLTNSLKHAILPKGGGKISVALHGDGESITLEVQDDGPGFSLEGKGAGEGTLGFGIVKALVKKRKGNVSVSEGGHPRVTCTLLREIEAQAGGSV